MGRYKNLVYARKLAEARAARPRGRPSSVLPWNFYLTFEESDGLGTLMNREIHAVISGREMAMMIGAIPAFTFRDDEDLKAVMRVTELLHGTEFND